MRRAPAVVAVGLCCHLGLQASAPAARAAAGDTTGPATVGRPIARHVLAIYDGAQAGSARDSAVHHLIEMPLNHLGLVVRYHDIRAGVPPQGALDDVRGVVTWLSSDVMRDPRAYLRWLERVGRAGIPAVIIGPLGALRDEAGAVVPLPEVNRALAPFGWSFLGGWHTTTAGVRYDLRRPEVLGFERRLPAVVPPYATARVTGAGASPALSLADSGRPGLASDVVILGSAGGYVAPGFAFFSDRSREREFRQWYLNPFEFFRAAFSTDQVPKPDIATLSGRRIYYSHIDGDGWRNLTQIEPHRTRHVIAARVVLDAVLRASADLPVTVGAIVADLDPAWAGTPESLAVAREIYALPHVEAAIHTYSHPLDWTAFDPATEGGPGGGAAAGAKAALVGPDVVHGHHEKPRTYDTRPFDLASEIDGAAQFVARLLPPDRRVALVQWSGDTRPFPQALLRARRAGLANLNGGDTRFDREFPSAAWVSPLGIRVGDELQVYASNSNENTYTDLWRDRFFGFSFLSKTVLNTGAPRRLRPFNLYYHMYSGERLSSLNAVLANLEFARTLALAPIEASRFSRIVEGFFSAELVSEGPRAWRIRRRGALQTVRFDGEGLGVDFERSQGVVGQRHELGSLFVALDETHPAPLVTLKTVNAADGEPRETVPYLVQSRWRVYEFRHRPGAARFAAEGFGAGEADVAWPAGGAVELRWRAASGRTGVGRFVRDADGIVRLRWPQATAERVDVTLTALEGVHASR